MRPAPLFCALSLTLLLAFASTGCVVHHHGHGVASTGPPPWAPAHGHRHHHHGRVLVFDAGLGVYVVSGRAGIYFHDSRYLRLRADLWEQALRPGGPWRPASIRGLPPGLAKRSAGKHARKRGRR